MLHKLPKDLLVKLVSTIKRNTHKEYDKYVVMTIFKGTFEAEWQVYPTKDADHLKHKK